MAKQNVTIKNALLSYIAQLALLGLAAGIISPSLAEGFGSRSVTYLLVIVLCVLVFWPIAGRIIRHSLDLAEPFIWFALFYFALFGVRAVWVLSFGSYFLGIGPDADNYSQINSALSMSILGFLSFKFGYQISAGRAIASSIPSLPRLWDWNLALATAVVSIILGWCIRLIMIVSEAGSISGWLAANKDQLLRTQGVAYLDITSSKLIVISILLVVIMVRIRGEKRLWALFGLLIIPEIGYGFMGGSRGALLYIVLNVIIAFFMTSDRTYKTSLRFAYCIGSAVLLAAMFFPIFSALRYQGVAGISNIPSFFIVNPTELFKVFWERLHGVDSLALIMSKVPSDIPYTLGSELGLIAVSWIPRAIWLDKPTISLGRIFCQEMVPPGILGEGTSVAITLPGEFYWDLGITGVFIGMMLIGILWRFLYEYFVRPKDNLSNMLVVAALFPLFFVPAEQDLVAIFTGHIFSLFIVLMIVFAISRKRDTSTKV